jgi:hypothetical protein
MNTIFMNIVLSPLTEGVPNSWGDMYVKALGNGLIKSDGRNSTQYVNTKTGVQAWVDGIIGKDINGESKLVVEGYFKGDGTKSSDIIKKIQALAYRGVLAAGGRNNGHSMTQFITNRTWGVYDTGWPRSKSPRPYGDRFSLWYKKEKTSSFWILKP